MNIKKPIILVVFLIILLGAFFLISPPKEPKTDETPEQALERLNGRQVDIDDETVIRESLDYVMSRRISDEEKAKYSASTGRIINLQADTINLQANNTTPLLDPAIGWYDDTKGDFAYAEKCKFGPGCDTVLDKDGFVASFFTTNAWTGLAHYGANLQDSFKERADEELYWAICDMQLVEDVCNSEPERCLWVTGHINILYEELKGGPNKIYDSLNSPLFYPGYTCPHSVENKLHDISDGYESTITNIAANAIGNPRTDDTLVASFESRGFIAAYKLTGNPAYLQAAKNGIDQAKTDMWPKDTLLYVNGGYVVRENMCWTMIAELDVYDVTGNATYLFDAKTFADNSRVDTHVGDTNFIGEVAPCLEVLSRLDIIDSKYTVQASRIKTFVYNQNLDSPSAPIYDGNGGFVAAGLQALGATDLTAWGNMKTVLDTSYMVYVLGKYRKEAL